MEGMGVEGRECVWRGGSESGMKGVSVEWRE